MFLTPRGWHLLHHILTSSNGSIFRVTGPLCGEFTGLGEFHAQRPVTRSFGVFFDLRLNKRLSKQPWGWWFETPPWSLWRHCNERLALEISYSYATHATVTVTLQRRLVCKCHIGENVFVVLRYIYIYIHIYWWYLPICKYLIFPFGLFPEQYLILTCCLCTPLSVCLRTLDSCKQRRHINVIGTQITGSSTGWYISCSG